MPEIRKVAKAKKRAFVLPLSLSSGTSLISPLRQKLKNVPHAIFPASADALQERQQGDHIVLIDDNSVSGTQAAAHLYSRLHSDRSSWPTELQLETEISGVLEGDLLDKFEGAEISVLVTFGQYSAGDLVVKHPTALGFHNFRGVKYVQEIAPKNIWPERLEMYLKRVGADLFAQDRWGKSYKDLGAEDALVCDQHSFGYSNVGGSTFFQNAVPTSTVNAWPVRRAPMDTSCDPAGQGVKAWLG